jgi:hypothetical protein
MLARYRIGLLVAIAVVLVVALVATWTVISRFSAHDGPTAGTDPKVSTTAVSTSTGVCGFDGALVGKITADRRAGAAAPAPRTWRIDGDGSLGGLGVNRDGVVVERDRDQGGSQFARFSASGRAEGRFTAPADADGAWTLAGDGSLFILAAQPGSARRVVHLGADGSRLGSFDVPRSRETTGSPHDLHDITAVPDYHGSAALLIGEGEHTVHALRPSGQDLGVVAHVPDVIRGSLGGSLVWGTSTTGGAAPITALEVVDLSTGAVELHAVFRSGDDDEPRSTTPSPYRLASVVRGPGGDGWLLGTAYGVQWVDDLGVRKGVWLAGQDGFSPADPASVVEQGGRYWVAVTTGDDARDAVATLSSAQMSARMAAPLLSTADTETDLAQLGLGIGGVTHVPFNHFDAGTTPAVFLRTEKGWGPATGDRPGLEVRYTVGGDPTLADPVSSEPQTAEIPWGGGETALRLPAPRPGPYEISLAVVDTSSGTVLSGSCVRYSIGAPGADLGFGSLAPGDDWGGPAPLRGVQLAAALGVGSQRVQLDFGALISDPSSAPRADAINWTALPGAGLSDDPEGDPFQDLRKAAVFADAHGVRLIVQVGSGGDAEKSAVSARTWAGWVGLIVAEFARQAPGITTWEAFNEPNNSYDKPDDYWKDVEIPFADAAHSARASSYVIGGNTLGFDTEWWKRAAADGVCGHIDAIGVHPYTGWNRSWEEEGFERADAGWAALSKTIGPGCAALPRWDTESGWTADGATAYWGQGSNVARKLLWYQRDRIAGWTYFFSEGGWGENDLSWSLIQYRSYVKPGGLAFATVSRLLEKRGRPVIVDSGIPFTHVMRVPGDDTMLVAWTDEARLSATLTTDAASATATDQYGGTSRVELSGRSAVVTLTATPQFFRVAAGRALELSPREGFGADLLKGQRVSASSTFKDADAQVITSGTADPYRPWRSGTLDGKVDPDPEVTIPLAAPTTIDRIGVATANIACCEAGLRGYTVSVQKPDGSWQTVAHPTDQFWERTVVFRFDPIEVKAVRVRAEWTTIRGVKMLHMNYTGFSGGLPPPFMGLQTASDYVMSVSAVSAWAPASTR